MKSDFFFQSCGHCWVYQICWHIECSTFTASSFSVWNSSAGIQSPPLALSLVMLPKGHLTSNSRMSVSRWVITPLWLSRSWSQVGLRKHHYEQSYWRWWNSSWAISNPKRWCCESAALNMPVNMENSAVTTGLEKVSFQSNLKEGQCQRMLKLPQHCTHLTR